MTTTANPRFRSNKYPHPLDQKGEKFITGEDMTVPGQSSSITEIVYRFQGGIIPTARNVMFDNFQDDDQEIDVRNIAGFDITDAYQALQAGKEKYKAYMTEKNAKAREAVEAQKAELARLQELEKSINQQKATE